MYSSNKSRLKFAKHWVSTLRPQLLCQISLPVPMPVYCCRMHRLCGPRQGPTPLPAACKGSAAAEGALHAWAPEQLPVSLLPAWERRATVCTPILQQHRVPTEALAQLRGRVKSSLKCLM